MRKPFSFLAVALLLLAAFASSNFRSAECSSISTLTHPSADVYLFNLGGIYYKFHLKNTVIGSAWELEEIGDNSTGVSGRIAYNKDNEPIIVIIDGATTRYFNSSCGLFASSVPPFTIWGDSSLRLKFETNETFSGVQWNIKYIYSGKHGSPFLNLGISIIAENASYGVNLKPRTSYMEMADVNYQQAFSGDIPLDAPIGGYFWCDHWILNSPFAALGNDSYVLMYLRSPDYVNAGVNQTGSTTKLCPTDAIGWDSGLRKGGVYPHYFWILRPLSMGVTYACSSWFGVVKNRGLYGLNRNSLFETVFYYETELAAPTEVYPQHATTQYVFNKMMGRLINVKGNAEFSDWNYGFIDGYNGKPSAFYNAAAGLAVYAYGKMTGNSSLMQLGLKYADITGNYIDPSTKMIHPYWNGTHLINLRGELGYEGMEGGCTVVNYLLDLYQLSHETRYFTWAENCLKKVVQIQNGNGSLWLLYNSTLQRSMKYAGNLIPVYTSQGVEAGYALAWLKLYELTLNATCLNCAEKAINYILTDPLRYPHGCWTDGGNRGGSYDLTPTYYILAALGKAYDVTGNETYHQNLITYSYYASLNRYYAQISTNTAHSYGGFGVGQNGICPHEGLLGMYFALPYIVKYSPDRNIFYQLWADDRLIIDDYYESGVNNTSRISYCSFYRPELGYKPGDFIVVNCGQEFALYLLQFWFSVRSSDWQNAFVIRADDEAFTNLHEVVLVFNPMAQAKTISVEVPRDVLVFWKLQNFAKLTFNEASNPSYVEKITQPVGAVVNATLNLNSRQYVVVDINPVPYVVSVSNNLYITRRSWETLSEQRGRLQITVNSTTATPGDVRIKVGNPNQAILAVRKDGATYYYWQKYDNGTVVIKNVSGALIDITVIDAYPVIVQIYAMFIAVLTAFSVATAKLRKKLSERTFPAVLIFMIAIAMAILILALTVSLWLPTVLQSLA